MNRRLLLAQMAVAAVLPFRAGATIAPLPTKRHLRLVNPHTGETFNGAYRDDRGPIAAAMSDLSMFLRDFHCAAVTEIDVGVIDFLSAVMEAVNEQTATILSAYRTRETNKLLAQTAFGVAENSQHIHGRALDIHFGNSLSEAVVVARAMHRGGVGWYPHSGFMHIDTGPVRNWDLDENGLARLLFAAQGMRISGSPARERDDRILPALERSGRLLPKFERSGRLLPEAERSGRLLR